MADCWYKGNMHMHFFSSDGHDFPESVTGWCKEHGDHFIAFTEHHQHQIGERWLRGEPETPGSGTGGGSSGGPIRDAVRLTHRPQAPIVSSQRQAGRLFRRAEGHHLHDLV
jgi:hypothetical protein